MPPRIDRSPSVRVRRCARIVTLVLLCAAAVIALSWSPRTHPRFTAVPASAAASTPRERPTYTPSPDVGFVGSERCGECHAEIAAAYRTHPMALSLRVISGSSPAAHVTREESRVVGRQRVLDVDMVDGVLRHHELMFDRGGKLIYDHTVPMQYVVGSGRRGEAFLYRRGDALFMSPLNWYSGPQKWDLAPGYQEDDPRRFDRRVTDECLSCHAGRVASLGRNVNRYAQPAFYELAIGCERCHGPGAAHIALHEAAETVEDVVDPIVNPASLDAERQESVCDQCHMQSAVRLPRVGRSEFDFRPGQRLGEIWTVMDTSAAAADASRMNAVSHVQQMRASRCFAASDGRLGCTSCHDPHRIPAPAEREAYFRERCLNCHSPDACTEITSRRRERHESCIACHMPARAPGNVSHVAETEHRIPRRPDESHSVAATGESLSFVAGTDTGLTDWERDRALALGAWIYLTDHQKQPPLDLGRHLEDVLRRGPEDGTELTVLASIALDYGRTDQAASYYERALSDPAGEEAALAGLLKIRYLARDFDQALQYADRLIAFDPGNWRALSLRADILKSLGHDEEAIESAHRALDFNPSLIEVREWLVAACRDTGRTDEQLRQQQILERMRDARAGD